MNVFFGGADNLCKLLDKTTAIETWAISKDIAANEDGDNTTYLNASYLNENNSFNETITKHICTIPTIAVIPKGFSLHLVLGQLNQFLSPRTKYIYYHKNPLLQV